MDNLANDIARGQGEYLNTLAVLMDVPEVSRTDFYARLQNNFSLIYTSPEIKSGDVLRNIEALM
jgi:L-fucose mutarotase/ribose pyranase (RbsD/FucU family)